MALVATSCKEAPKETQPSVEIEATEQDPVVALLTAIDFVKEHLGVEMEKPEVKCSRSQINEQCIGKKCPFSPIDN